jgi:hypothetical protein
LLSLGKHSSVNKVDIKERMVHMRKLLMVVGFAIGFAVCVYAQDASTVANQVTTELQKSGTIAAADAPSVSSSVKTLVESGATAQEAKSVVAQAAKQAKAQGLKGKDLAAKVKEAAKIRKAQLDEVKKKAKETEAKAKKEAEAKKKGLQNKLNKGQ